MIKVENVCFDYPSKRALDHISFEIAPQTITAIVGPNGAGKTTLLRCLCALETPLNGTIRINEWDTDRHPRKIHELSSYLSDVFGLYEELTVLENLIYIALSHGFSLHEARLAAEKSATQLELTHYLGNKAETLSRGLRQKLAIAQTIIHSPQYILLDEPASGLDPTARVHLSTLLLNLQKEGMTIIVSSHILAELEDYCSHMLILSQGKNLLHCPVKGQMQDLYLHATSSDKLVEKPKDPS